MPVIPGYDFSAQELVKPDKLLQWLLGAQVYPAGSVPAAGSGLSIGSIIASGSSASLADGDLGWNTLTGHLEVGTRWGSVPVLSGSAMFTKRFRRWFGSTPVRQRFYGGFMLMHPGAASTVSHGTPSLLETDWENYTPLKSGDWSGDGGAGNPAIGPVVLWPSADQPGLHGSLYTEASFTDLCYRLLCLRGWTPMYGSGISSVTSGLYALSNGGFIFSPTGEVNQITINVQGFQRITNWWETAIPSFTHTYYGYLRPVFGKYLTTSGLPNPNMEL